MIERKSENKLLILANTILIVGLIAINLARGSNNYNAVFFAVAICSCWLIVNAMLKKKGCQGDSLALPIAAALSAIGLIVIYRLKPELYYLQVLWILVGMVAFALSYLLSRHIDKLAQYKYICGFAGVILLVATILFGSDIGGNKNWIILGPIRFQPSEFAKLFFVFFLAAYLSERREVLSFTHKRYGFLVLPHPRYLAPMIPLWALSMAMFVLQRDLGSALLFFGTAIIMMYIASGRIVFISLGTAMFIVGSLACYALYPHIQTRVDIWLNPWVDPNGRAYQIVQSLFALGSGGILGSGLTYGFPQLIPEVHTDFIFSAIGEELGFLGTAAVILLYVLIIYRFFRTALSTRTVFLNLVAAGFAVLLALQVFLIIAGVTKFFPLTGITLPFLSYGGSSIVSSFLLLGILLGIADVRHHDVR